MPSGTSATGTAKGITIPPHTPGDHQNRPRIQINPPRLQVGSGAAKASTVTITNGTTHAAMFWIPRGESVFELPADVPHFDTIIKIAPGSELTLRVKESPNPGTYPYHVFCHAISHFADGNSAPEITVP
jgi:hypothetical protein